MRCFLASKRLVVRCVSAGFLVTGEVVFSQDGGEMTELPMVVVEGKAESLIGTAPSASKGQASREELMQRPISRRGELLETVPGVVVTQHAGDGKANQYFVRGSNLDHGTDFALFVDGIPINFRNHAHGQGYADLNFIIPEMLEQLEYWKGNYYAFLGDLSSNGAARFRLSDHLEQGMATFTWGEYNYYRGVLADSVQAGEGTLTFAMEYSFYDGPWVLAQGSERWNGLLKYHWTDGIDTVRVTLMGTQADWTSTDQIPQRAVQSGQLGRFGFVDPTNGGDSQRYSLSGAWERVEGGVRTYADVYAGYYDLDLFSNFTYFLNDPVRGDQFEQKDGRWFVGGNTGREWRFDVGGREQRLNVGFQTYHEWINGIGLYLTQARRRFETVREDDIYQGTYGLFAEMEWRFTDWLRVTPGVRGDVFHSSVTSDFDANSGSTVNGIVNPKLGVVLGPWAETEFYLNGGLGFHSNDARGVTISRDPGTGDRVTAADPLVRTYGAEFGIRNESIPKVVNTLSLWYLKSDSELVYVGDAGTSEAGPASQKYGVELSSYWRPTDWAMLDVEATATYSELMDSPEGRYIPGSVPYTLNGGFTLGGKQGFFASLRGRYIGPRPLIEDASVKSREVFQVNARVGYRKADWELAVDCLNLFDRGDNDIAYFYESRLRGESRSREDVHVHPIVPRMVRVSLTYRW
jgi:hypothetical protein